MKTPAFDTKTLLSIAIAACLTLGACARHGRSSRVEKSIDPLTAQIALLDTEVFSAFNQCSDPAQLQKHADYFAPDVEFYHDTGGVTWTRQEMLQNTEKYVCGKFRRELVSGSLRVFPIKDFGALSQGSHRFCQFASGDCEGIADFTMVWRNTENGWKITRVLSYGHRANKSS
jgi:hypothetical protein